MRAGLRARVVIAGATLALLLVALFAVILVTVDQLREADRLATRAAQVAASANELQRLTIDAQSATRGYIMSGDERFLEPWENARAAFPDQAVEFQLLVVDPGQRERAREITGLVRSYLDDFAAPLVETARGDLEAASAIVAAGEGKRQVDAIRAAFDRFARVEDAIASEREERADAAADRAIGAGAGAAAGSVLLVLLFVAYFGRSIVAPLRRTASAADRIAAGDLAVRTDGAAVGEIGVLARSFNAMAASLEEGRDELEAQNRELELQAVELEAQQGELSDANAELERRQDALEQAHGELSEEKERIEAFYAFGSRLARETELDALAALVLSGLADLVGADVGALYVKDDDESCCALAAVRGLARQSLPAEIGSAGGLGGRALAEGRPVMLAYGETSLRLQAFGHEVVVRHELHVPLKHASHVLGVLTLGRAGSDAFADDDIEALTHLGGQAAIALANSISLRDAVRSATVQEAVLDATEDAIVLVDVDGRAVVVNAAARRLVEEVFDVDADASVEDWRSGERTIDPERYRILAALADDPAVEAHDDFTLTDSGRSFRRYSAPVRDDEGELLGRIVVLRDVTSERAAERLKSDLVATVSHELRTPLASILGFAELLVMRDVDADTRARYVETIYKEGKRLTNLINDFLDLQRIEEGRLTLARASVDLTEVLREQVDLFGGQSERHAVALDVPGEGLTIEADRDRISQVVANLLSNAIKFSPAGGRVAVTAARKDETVRIHVSDEGVGIPAEQQGRLFSKFFRVETNDTREIGGTGLGLALAREIVEAHGGRIGVSSAEGKGSTFWFELPAADR